MSRVLGYVFVLLFIVGLNFALPRLLPGDPLTALVGEQDLIISPAYRQELRERYGLDQPLWRQLVEYAGRLSHGDLGYSVYYQAPVAKVMGPALLWTALLCGTSFLLSTCLGTWLGVELAVQRRRSWTAAAVGGCLVLESLPGFLLGMALLLIFSLKLGWFPFFGALEVVSQVTRPAALGLGILWHLILPASTLMLAEAPGVALLVRASLLKVLAAPFVLAARARGLTEARIKYRYQARNALLPLITRLGLRFGMLWAMALPVEVVFAYPGAGQLLYQALLKRDYPLIQGLLLVSILTVLAGNALADWGYRWADPRVRSRA
jgi:peptide/nickel transport system permease protein|uniref:ABC transporter permease n=1 Tax=Desulfobacca acetoxidans TaxID=60893 RepID=A0A7V6DQM0_9BACT